MSSTPFPCTLHVQPKNIRYKNCIIISGNNIFLWQVTFVQNAKTNKQKNQTFLLFCCDYGYTFSSLCSYFSDLLINASMAIASRRLLLWCKRVLFSIKLDPSEFCFNICVTVDTAWTHMKPWSSATSSFAVWKTKTPKLNYFKRMNISGNPCSQKNDTHQRCSFLSILIFKKNYLHICIKYFFMCKMYVLPP